MFCFLFFSFQDSRSSPPGSGAPLPSAGSWGEAGERVRRGTQSPGWERVAPKLLCGRQILNGGLLGREGKSPAVNIHSSPAISYPSRFSSSAVTRQEGALACPLPYRVRCPALYFPPPFFFSLFFFFSLLYAQGDLEVKILGDLDFFDQLGSSCRCCLVGVLSQESVPACR